MRPQNWTMPNPLAPHLSNYILAVGPEEAPQVLPSPEEHELGDLDHSHVRQQLRHAITA